MSRMTTEKPSDKITIRYLSNCDMRNSAAFASKFMSNPIHRSVYKGLCSRRDIQPLVVSKEGHPIVFLLLKRENKHAVILAIEELIVGTMDRELSGRVADFLAVEYLVCTFRDFEQAEYFGNVYGMVGYTCDISHPAVYKGIELSKNGTHPTEPLRFSIVTPNQFDIYPPVLLKSMLSLGLNGMKDELVHDEMNVYEHPLVKDGDSALQRWFRLLIKNNKNRHAVIWHTEDRKIVGMVSLETQDPFNGKEVAIRGLTIAPEYRGRGYGKLLLKYAMSRMDARAVDITADILHGNVACRSIFEGVGFFNITQIDRGTPRLVNGYYKHKIKKNKEYFLDEEVPECAHQF